MLNRFARYLPILKIINDRDNPTILEIGSGPSGLAEFHIGTVVGCDVGFRGPLAQGLLPVCALGAALPFPDKAFQLTVCLDVLEHVQPDLRQALLQEAVRVTGQCLIVGFPSGTWANMADQLLAFSYRVRRHPVPDWLDEHSKYPFPSFQETEEILDSNDLHVITQGNENLLTHLLIMLAESSRRIEPRLTRSVHGKNRAFWQRLLAHLEIAPFYRRLIVAKYSPPDKQRQDGL